MYIPLTLTILCVVRQDQKAEQAKLRAKVAVQEVSSELITVKY